MHGFAKEADGEVEHNNDNNCNMQAQLCKKLRIFTKLTKPINDVGRNAYIGKIK